MQRKAYVPGVAALLAALVTGCTAGDGTEGSDIDAKVNGAKASAAPPASTARFSSRAGPSGFPR